MEPALKTVSPVDLEVVLLTSGVPENKYDLYFLGPVQYSIVIFFENHLFDPVEDKQFRAF